MAVGKGSMARASRAAAKEKEPVKDVKVAEEQEVKGEAGAVKKKAPGRKPAAKKKPVPKKEAEGSKTVGIGQEMPVHYY